MRKTTSYIERTLLKFSEYFSTQKNGKYGLRGRCLECTRKYDKERTKFLEQYGLRIIRIPNNEINQNFDGVCEYLDNIILQSLSQT